MYYNYEDLDAVNQELAAIWPDWYAVKLLGMGSFGAVYEIHRNVRSNMEKAAVKILRVPSSEAEVEQLHFQGMELQNAEEYFENYVDSLQSEIRIMQNFVGNSHIVSYEDYSIRKRQDAVGWDIYIRMELLTGLQEFLDHYPMDDTVVIRLGADILLALCDCHSSGIIHRDIKPGNIFVNRVGHFKLGDFGISRIVSDSKDVMTFRGTLSYMAPEVYQRKSTDARSDIYSLGMVLYQCLNENRLPFVPRKFSPGDIEEARARRMSGEWIPDPVHGSDGLKAVVRKALAYRPEDRYQTAEEMYSALADVYGTDYDGKSIVRYSTDNNTVSKPVSGEKTVIASEKKSVLPKVLLILALILALAVGVAVFWPKGVPESSDSAESSDSLDSAESSESPDSAENSDSLDSSESSEILESSENPESSDLPESSNTSDSSSQPADPSQKTESQNTPDYAMDWQDAALEAKIREVTGIRSGVIMFSDVRDIATLDLSNTDEKAGNDVKIKNIEALGCLTNLKILKLNGHQIKDISGLRDLTNLEELSLENNKVEDISALSKLTKLEELDLSHNQVKDLDVLTNLTNLKRLYLLNNQISDISTISGLTELDKLSLGTNKIEDVSALRDLTSLKRLYLYNNKISDISALSGLTELDKLSLGDNQIEDISALGGLTNLKRLYLYNNRITDISALSNLTNLIDLSLYGNQITDYSPIEGLSISSLQT